MPTSATRDTSLKPVQRVPMNDLKRSVAELKGLDEAIVGVLKSGWWLQGPETKSWEQALAAYVDAKHVVAVASGTDALALALRALSGPSGTVLTAANCGGYTTTAARQAGLAVRYCDVDEATHLMTAETVAAALTPDVTVVVVTHLYGRAAEIDEIFALCSARGIMVVEDCAQAIGARTTHGRSVGSVGHMGAFSFYPTKNLGAIGDAGAIVTASDDLASAVRRLAQYGWSSKYEIATVGGQNSRTDEVQAAVLRRKLPHLDSANERRRAIVARYVAAASPRISVLPAEGQGHVAHLAVAVADDRNAFTEHAQALGIDTGVHYPIPDHQQAAFRDQNADVRLPVTEALASSIVSLPLFPELTEDEIRRVERALSSF